MRVICHQRRGGTIHSILGDRITAAARVSDQKRAIARMGQKAELPRFRTVQRRYPGDDRRGVASLQAGAATAAISPSVS
jgi:hypothetical protein